MLFVKFCASLKFSCIGVLISRQQLYFQVKICTKIYYTVGRAVFFQRKKQWTTLAIFHIIDLKVILKKDSCNGLFTENHLSSEKFHISMWCSINFSSGAIFLKPTTFYAKETHSQDPTEFCDKCSSNGIISTT